MLETASPGIAIFAEVMRVPGFIHSGKHCSCAGSNDVVMQWKFGNFRVECGGESQEPSALTIQPRELPAGEIRKDK
jgi:hypothetical protein